MILETQNQSLTNRASIQLQRQYEVSQFTLSPDHRYLLLVHDVKKTGHHGTLARYTIFDIRLHTFTPVRVKDLDNEYHQHGQWAPKPGLLVSLQPSPIVHDDHKQKLNRMWFSFLCFMF